MTTPTSEFWKGRSVVVTGGAGFLRGFIVERPKDLGAETFVPRKREYDLIDFGACMKCLAEATGFKGRLRWNAEKPDGQEFKVLDVSRMKRELSWEPATSLRDGLQETVEWYAANKTEADERS